MTQPPAAWFPDPEHPGQLRYWDGVQWTAHVAPSPVAAPPSPTPPPAKGGGLPVWAIVVICSVALLFVIGILAAIAIPVYLNQQSKAADAAAQASLNNLAIAIADYGVDYPMDPPTVTSPPAGTPVEIAAPDGTVVQVVQLEDGVELGGFTTYNDGNWCVWVDGDGDPWHWSTVEALGVGSCP